MGVELFEHPANGTGVFLPIIGFGSDRAADYAEVLHHTPSDIAEQPVRLPPVDRLDVQSLDDMSLPVEVASETDFIRLLAPLLYSPIGVQDSPPRSMPV